MNLDYTIDEAATALVSALSGSFWEAVALARVHLLLEQDLGAEELAQAAFEQTGKRVTRTSLYEKALQISQGHHFTSFLTPRPESSYAADPVRKLFPGRITEQRFVDKVKDLVARRPTLALIDDRQLGHTLVDFTIREDEDRLPVNVKNAGTRFEKAADLVGIDSDDCVPIPVYKASQATDDVPSLLYVIAVDYELSSKLESELENILNRDELIVWDMIVRFGGTGVKNAEDLFVNSAVDGHWEQFSNLAADTPFHAISAKKAMQILRMIPRRTPGIGMKAWGTQATAEVNVHISLSEDATDWSAVADQIVNHGLPSVFQAIHRQQATVIDDPQI